MRSCFHREVDVQGEKKSTTNLFLEVSLGCRGSQASGFLFFTAFMLKQASFIFSTPTWKRQQTFYRILCSHLGFFACKMSAFLNIKLLRAPSQDYLCVSVTFFLTWTRQTSHCLDLWYQSFGTGAGSYDHIALWAGGTLVQLRHFAVVLSQSCCVTWLLPTVVLTVSCSLIFESLGFISCATWAHLRVTGPSCIRDCSSNDISFHIFALSVCSVTTV